jgi:SMC interacting uncharacterized protein involved in chromosome segregation
MDKNTEMEDICILGLDKPVNQNIIVTSYCHRNVMLALAEKYKLAKELEKLGKQINEGLEQVDRDKARAEEIIEELNTMEDGIAFEK